MQETTNIEGLFSLAERLARAVQVFREAAGDTPLFSGLCKEAEAVLGDRAKFDVRTVKVDAVVRYPEDAVVNGQHEDNDKPTMPFLHKNDEGEWVWSVAIEAKNGVILGWPIGKIARIFYKVCDRCRVELDNGIVRDEYVPPFLCTDDDGYGDYIYMTIDGDGKIRNWNQQGVKDWVVQYVKNCLED